MDYEMFTPIYIIIAGLLLLALFHWWATATRPRKHMREAEPAGVMARRPRFNQIVVLSGQIGEDTRFLGVNEGGALCIRPTGRGVIYITSEEAKEFFGLTEHPGYGLADAARYVKLRGWMSSNVPEGWSEVERLGALAAWESWDAMDAYLDSLPECSVGLMSKALRGIPAICTPPA